MTVLKQHYVEIAGEAEEAETEIPFILLQHTVPSM